MPGGYTEVVRVKHSFEYEVRSEAGREPMLYATILSEGRAASRLTEVFTPGSIRWPSTGIDITIEHGGPLETRAHPIRQQDGQIKVMAPATAKIQQAYAEGKRWMSIEFMSLEERTTSGGIREILRAFVPTAAMTSRPHYDSTHAEVRAEEQEDLLRRAWLWL